MYSSDDTITGIATAQGGAARGVVRLSGPATPTCLSRCFVPDADVPLTELERATVVSGTIFAGDVLGELPGEE